MDNEKLDKMVRVAKKYKIDKRESLLPYFIAGVMWAMSIFFIIVLLFS